MPASKYNLRNGRAIAEAAQNITAKNESRSTLSAKLKTLKRIETSSEKSKLEDPKLKEEPVELTSKEEQIEIKPEPSDTHSDIKSTSPVKRKHSTAFHRKPTQIEYEYQLNTLPDIEDCIWAPDNWKQQYVNIRLMREDSNAPVDSMGCDKISDRSAKPNDYRYQVLLSLLLSSQTKDEVTSAAVNRLCNYGCSVQNILSTTNEKLGELIYPVGFWKKKVEYIKRTSEILRDKYSCDVPNNIKELTALPGIGPKMAHLIMKCAWGQTTGIAVDTHVYRITQRLGWIKKKPKHPEDLRKQLEDWLPQSLWSEVNWLLVGFGQQICSGQHPRCNDCLNNSICPFSRTNSKTTRCSKTSEVKKERS